MNVSEAPGSFASSAPIFFVLRSTSADRRSPAKNGPDEGSSLSAVIEKTFAELGVCFAPLRLRSPDGSLRSARGLAHLDLLGKSWRAVPGMTLPVVAYPVVNREPAAVESLFSPILCKVYPFLIRCASNLPYFDFLDRLSSTACTDGLTGLSLR